MSEKVMIENSEEIFLPKYRKIALFLENELKKSFLGEKMLSDREVSKKFKVSLLTARQAFDHLQRKGLIRRIPGQGTFIVRKNFPEIKKKIISLILDGYYPSWEFMKLLEKEGRDAGIDIILKSSDSNLEREREILETLDERLISGAILWPVGTAAEDNSHVETFLKKGMPLVLIDRYIKGLTCGYVGFDNIKAGYISAKHLFHNDDCKIIYFITYPVQISSVLERIDGFNRAVEEEKIEGSVIRPESKLIFSSYPKDVGSQGAAIVKDRENKDRKIGVILANEQIAEGFVGYFEDKGGKVPETFCLAIIGDLSARLNTRYMTVHLPREEMGKKAIECLNRLITAKGKGETGQPEKIILDVGLNIQDKRKMRKNFRWKWNPEIGKKGEW